MWDITDTGKRIIELLKQGEKSLGALYALLETSDSHIRRNLEKLEQRRIITRLQRSHFTYFRLSSELACSVNERLVRCPKCRTTKKIYDKQQTATSCPNKECKTPIGIRTRFWILTRDKKSEINNA